MASIKAADHDADWVLLISVDPGSEEVLEMVRAIDWIETKISVNSFHMGSIMNTFLAANLAHALGSRFNIFMEDDVVISRDAITMAEWFSSSPFAVEASILNFRRRKEDQSKPMTLAHDSCGPLAEGTCYDVKWWPNHFRSYWFGFDRRMNGFGWDYSLHWKLIENNFKQYRPWINRSRNIGLVGTHTPPGWFDPERCGPEYQGKQGEFNMEE